MSFPQYPKLKRPKLRRHMRRCRSTHFPQKMRWDSLCRSLRSGPQIPFLLWPKLRRRMRRCRSTRFRRKMQWKSLCRNRRSPWRSCGGRWATVPSSSFLVELPSTVLGAMNWSSCWRKACRPWCHRQRSLSLAVCAECRRLSHGIAGTVLACTTSCPRDSQAAFQVSITMREPILMQEWHTLVLLVTFTSLWRVALALRERRTMPLHEVPWSCPSCALVVPAEGCSSSRLSRWNSPRLPRRLSGNSSRAPQRHWRSLLPLRRKSCALPSPVKRLSRSPCPASCRRPSRRWMCGTCRSCGSSLVGLISPCLS